MNAQKAATKVAPPKGNEERLMTILLAPVVSVSLGLPAIFQFGGLNRADPIRKYALHHGDVAIWGGPSRLCYHGLLALKDGEHPKLRRTRLNLTFRRAL